MTGIAVAQASSGQVKHSDEKGDEHIGLVTFTSILVDGLHDVRRIALVLGQTAELGVYHGHHQRGRHALAAHVTDAEV